MSKKSHRSHISQVQPATHDAQSLSASHADSNGVTAIRDTLQQGLNTGVEAAKDAVSSAKGAAHSLVETMETMAHDAEETLVDAGHSLMATAKKNPIPLALAGLGVACAGIGITMLVLNARRSAAA